MVMASFLFATMGVCVKLAAAHYGIGEIVFYRGVTGAVMMALLMHWQGGTLLTRVPAMHLSRSLTGVMALCLWFYALGKLPVATAMTLNYTSSVWMAMFLLGAAMMSRAPRVDGRLVATVLLGFVGVAMILQPTVEQNQLWPGLVGLLSGMISATAYLQVTSLARAGEPEYRIVFYFSLGSVAAGAVGSFWLGWHAHTVGGIALLLAVGSLATVAQMMMTRAYGIGRPLVNASLQYLGIAFSFGYGVLLFDDRITWFAVLGMVLVVGAGVLAVQSRVATTKAVRGTT
jgi:drug/metabolite transporter (DMT)-like permease